MKSIQAIQVGIIVKTLFGFVVGSMIAFVIMALIL